MNDKRLLKLIKRRESSHMFYLTIAQGTLRTIKPAPSEASHFCGEKGTTFELFYGGYEGNNDTIARISIVR